MERPEWLRRYYGRDLDLFNPEVVLVSERYAVVKLTKTGAAGYHSVGYVLIKKDGFHASSKYLALHEGPATEKVIERMAKNLADVEENGYL